MQTPQTRYAKTGDDVLEDHQRVGGDQQARVIVDHVQDLDLALVCEAPVGDVGLPALVGLRSTLPQVCG
jgi:hypothetical protein